MECWIVIVSLEHEVGGTSEAFAKWHAHVLRQDFTFRTDSLKSKLTHYFCTDLRKY